MKLHEIYDKQRKSFEKKFDEDWPSVRSYTGGTMQNYLLSSRHKDTIELIEAIIKEVEGMKVEGVGGDGDGGWVNFKGNWDEFNEAYGRNQALSDLLTKLQAELTLLKNER